MVSVGKYSIHGAYGISHLHLHSQELPHNSHTNLEQMLLPFLLRDQNFLQILGFLLFYLGVFPGFLCSVIFMFGAIGIGGGLKATLPFNDPGFTMVG